MDTWYLNAFSVCGIVIHGMMVMMMMMMMMVVVVMVRIMILIIMTTTTRACHEELLWIRGFSRFASIRWLANCSQPGRYRLSSPFCQANRSGKKTCSVREAFHQRTDLDEMVVEETAMQAKLKKGEF